MRRHHGKLRLSTKLALAAALALLIAAWVFSGWWRASVSFNLGSIRAGLSVEAGKLNGSLNKEPVFSRWELKRRGRVVSLEEFERAIVIDDFADLEIERWGWWPNYFESDGTRFCWVPLWFFAAALAPMFAIVAWKDSRRVRKGLCRSCGYDRRGLAVDAPCPECGSEP